MYDAIFEGNGWTRRSPLIGRIFVVVLCVCGGGGGIGDRPTVGAV
jgi:hypothetical protein